MIKRRMEGFLSLNFEICRLVILLFYQFLKLLGKGNVMCLVLLISSLNLPYYNTLLSLGTKRFLEISIKSSMIKKTRFSELERQFETTNDQDMYVKLQTAKKDLVELIDQETIFWQQKSKV